MSVTSVVLMFLVFYVGAVIASGRSWLGVWRGKMRFSELRDVTGIADRALLRRLFGGPSAHGFYSVTVAEILRCRRSAGVMLTNLPVHLMFLLALVWALRHSELSAALAIACAAAVHSLALATAAATILAGRQALPD
jgi:hypothetical protein